MQSIATKLAQPWRPLGGRPVARPGFSLVELVVVMLVLSVLAFIAVPRFEIFRYKMDGAARGTMAAMVASQRLAVKRQHDVAVMFDVTKRRLLIHQDRNNNGALDAGEPTRVVAFDDGVVYGLGGAPSLAGGGGPTTFSETHGGLPAVRFIRNGSASEDGVVYLTSTRAESGGGHARTAVPSVSIAPRAASPG